MHQVTRRTFIKDLGKGVFAIIVGAPVLAACAGDDTSPVVVTTSPPPPTSGAAAATTVGSSAPPATEPSATQPPATQPSATNAPTTTVTDGATTLQRINLGFVSAYVLARQGEASIVDTGNPGSLPQIEAGLGEIGLGWADVGSVVLTHRHPDHIGSVGAVMSAATSADGFAGAADIGSIPTPRPLAAVGDGDRVFGMDIIETPGHTPGHICVLDTAGGILVAGDALNGGAGGVVGPNPNFTPDMDTANESVKKLGALSFDTVVFGHGEPVRGGASDLVAALAATL